MSKVTGNDTVQNSVLEDLSSAFRYRRWLSSLASPYLGRNPVEIGSGLGDYALEWAAHCEQFTCSEAEEERLTGLRSRFSGHPNIRVVEMTVPMTGHAGYSAVVAYNVLEHIPDDVAALRAMADLVQPDGTVVLLVPAFEFAMSRFDREIGHQRRYTTRSLAKTAESAGLRVMKVQYVNAPGLLAWVLLMRVLRQRPRAGVMLALYDRFVVPVVARLEAGRRPPFGQSVFLVARTGS